ncbi:MAG: ABC transporter substrate-binding protein [Desulfobacterales bacterium]|nr:ABC transporter substrate-binding protein [Desulfobacterales bacterium]
MAGDRHSAQDVLQSKLDAVFTVLKEKDLEKQAKFKAIEDIVTPMFDFPLMAKLSLGKKHWSVLTEENRDHFSTLFVKRLRQSYLDKLLAYSDEKIIYGSAVDVDNKIHIPSDLVSKDKKISMLYKFYASKSGWRVYDIEIQGVSIVRSYRSQFAEILKKGSFNDLIQKLEKPIEN